MSYALIAPIYDVVMQHVDYGLWLDLIRKVRARYFPDAGIRIFEIGAGTGALGAKLSEEGFAYTGSDLDFHMAREALSKGLMPFCADARALPLRGPFDMVIFLYDGINYLVNLDEYRKLFSEAYKILAPRRLLSL